MKGLASEFSYEKIGYEKEDEGSWNIFPGLCKGCGLCKEKCPKSVITWSDELGVYGTPAVKCNIDGCILCGICQQVCPDTAIKVIRKKKEKKK
ncbi:4Fe-4S dicluster domain-containing protein [Natranaerofaba carboxydovora]|uniref:4Fe-4S dicluster domain-containing protein n=1 Tax=Natranaerofaba carboxydovora TaxID=2742683 RepID=UPI001F1396CF|nr:4Fe-4S binding protein [Natranaerofaba carboxydovora]UMZ75230.1 4Fe-4S binding domain protein [Natranaerofaba carboxydovora]